MRKSEPFGIPPLVASKSFPVEMKTRVREILLAMHEDPTGREILRELMINRFVAPKEQWYDSIRQIEQNIHEGK
jgi:phosphonate transport system substrate-binding protein